MNASYFDRSVIASGNATTPELQTIVNTARLAYYPNKGQESVSLTNKFILNNLKLDCEQLAADAAADKEKRGKVKKAIRAGALGNRIYENN